jgi:hypothetical protein
MTERNEQAHTQGGRGPGADEAAEGGDTGVAETPPRYEPTHQGEQAVIPGTPTPAIPTGPTRTQVPQRDIEETPLFGQDRPHRRRPPQKRPSPWKGR